MQPCIFIHINFLFIKESPPPSPPKGNHTTHLQSCIERSLFALVFLKITLVKH